MKTTVKKSALLDRLQMLRRNAVQAAWNARSDMKKTHSMREWYWGWMCGNRCKAVSLRRLIRDIEKGAL